MKNFEEMLIQKHLKRTKARVMIMKVLQKSLPLTAGEVYETVKKKDTQLSLSTVYRNCETLAENGLLVRSTSMTDGLTRYEYTHDTPTHHAVCLCCHRIFPVDIGLEPDYEKKLETQYGFAATMPRLEIYGFCKDCRKKGKGKEYLDQKELQ